MLRVIALAVALMMSLGAIIPLATNYSEAGPKHNYKKKKKKYKKYSKAWWHQYRQQQRRKRALMARKRVLKARQEMLASQRQDNLGDAPVMQSAGKSRQKVSHKENSAMMTTAILPSGESAPRTWKRGQASQGELQFRVDDDGGKQIGAASLSVVGPAMGEDENSPRSKTVGGVSTGALRRTVIDRMMKEEGWVVNDYQKELSGGKKVYVVVAQSKGTGASQVQSRIFYFTEVEGKIYSLSTNAPNEASERLAQDSEKVINSLQRVNRPTQAELR